MKITRKEYEEAYQLGRKVYSKSIRLTEAADALEKLGVSRSSGIILVSNLRRLLNGQCYTRALSITNTDDYLTWILRDYGEPAFRNAISALEQHIQYRSLAGVPMQSLIQVLERHRKLVKDDKADFLSPEEISSESQNDSASSENKLSEGRLKTVTVNYYERSAKARSGCLKAHGYVCSVCHFDFEMTYGAIGKEFIHVHHLRDLASIGKEYEINPIEDLRPVCPNCHAMLHKSNPPYTLEELKEIIAAHKK
jgi:5-methylcytosine-specific restriction enzyme A